MLTLYLRTKGPCQRYLHANATRSGRQTRLLSTGAPGKQAPLPSYVPQVRGACTFLSMAMKFSCTPRSLPLRRLPGRGAADTRSHGRGSAQALQVPLSTYRQIHHKERTVQAEKDSPCVPPCMALGRRVRPAARDVGEVGAWAMLLAVSRF